MIKQITLNDVTKFLCFNCRQEVLAEDEMEDGEEGSDSDGREVARKVSQDRMSGGGNGSRKMSDIDSMMPSRKTSASSSACPSRKWSRHSSPTRGEILRMDDEVCKWTLSNQIKNVFAVADAHCQ